MSTAVMAVPNSEIEIRKRAGSGRVSRAGPVGMILGRVLLFAFYQALIALFLALRGQADAWYGSAAWWQSQPLSSQTPSGLMSVW